MAKFCKIIFLLIFLPVLLFAQGNDLKFEHISVEHGLSNGVALCVLQDSKGFIWIGTEYGLNRYDGYTIKVFTHDPGEQNSISDNWIEVIYEDPADSGKVLWIGTKGGLNKLDLEKEKFTHYLNEPDDPTSLSHNKVTSICNDNKGFLWIGTWTGGLNRLNRETGEFTNFKNDPKNPFSLSDNRIASVCADRDGNLWVGAMDCLNKLNLSDSSVNKKIESHLKKDDQYQFQRYYLDKTSSTAWLSKYITDIFEDQNRVLWIASDMGLHTFDRKINQFNRYNLKTGKKEAKTIRWARSIFEDTAGELWFATIGQGLVNINSEWDRFTTYQHDPNSSSNFIPASNSISSVVVDHTGVIWVASFGFGVNKLIPKRKEFQNFKPIPGDTTSLSEDNVTSICEDGDGDLWVSSFDGNINKFDKGKKHFVEYPLYARHICRAQNGELWLAAGRNLKKFNPKNEKFIKYVAKDISYKKELLNWINRLQKQNRDIASIENRGDRQNFMQEFEITQTSKVLVVAKGRGSLTDMFDSGWLVKVGQNKPYWEMEAFRTRTFGGEFHKRIQISLITLDRGRYKLFYNSNNPDQETFEQSGISLYSILPEENRKISPLLHAYLIGTNLDIIRTLYYVYEDSEGIVWCLFGPTSGGKTIFQFDENKRQFSPYIILSDKKISKDVTLIYEDRSGGLWFGTSRNGIIQRIIPKNDSTGKEYKFKHYKNDRNDNHSISSNIINAFYEDGAGYLWIGTEAGLNKFDPASKTFQCFREKDGLSSDLIFGILEDDNGNLWLGTNKGISKFNPFNGTFKNFDKSDDLLSASYGKFEAYCKSGELLLFGSSDGLTAFSPDDIKDNLSVPKTVITDFKIFNKSVIPGVNSPLKKSISRLNEIILAYDQDVFSLEFAALDFTNPGKNKYIYKMEGVDPDWVHTDASRRFAGYTNLDPGEYVFSVKGSNNDGIWNEEGASLKIIITPPWWKTNWAYLSYFILFVGLFYSLRRYDLKRQRLKHDLELEHVHAEKLEEVDRLKSRFFANISHEFRTPLTLILGPIEQMISGKLKGNLVEQYKIIRRNGKRLLQLINQLLDLSKLESGKLKLQAQATEIISLTNGLVQAFESLALRKEITLKFKSEIKSQEVYIDVDKFEKIINNLLSNAFKFTPEDGVVEVVISEPTPPFGHTSQEGNSLQSPLSGGDLGVGKNLTEFVQIQVTNTGPGISADRIEKIFDRFYQVNDSYTKDGEGTGIGLALTKELVELHHGEISVESQKVIERAKNLHPPKSPFFKGDLFKTTFTILLPLGKEHLKEEEIIKTEEDSPLKKGRPPKAEAGARSEGLLTEALSKTPDETTEVEGKEPKSRKQEEKTKDKPIILIVEDNADLRQYIRNSMDSDYQIMEAENGEEGLAKATKEIPDLIISDVMMPKMDGFEFCAKIKTDERTSHIPLILITARATMEDKIEGLETGADDYITKPFEAREVQVRVKNLIEQRNQLREKFSRIIDINPNEIATTSTDEQFIKRLLDVFENHVAESDFSTEDFAREIGMSRSNLHRKLQALTNQPTHEFLRTLRLKRAAQLLKKSATSVTEVAYAVGFTNPSHFARIFRQQFGQSPSEFSSKNSTPK